MSMEILQRPDGPLDAWITTCPDYSQTALPPGTSHGNYRTSSPIIGSKMLDRPKSVPSSLGGRGSRKDALSTHYTGASHTATRPKTALGSFRTDCDRVLQVEQEPTRKQSLENHLPLKKPKTPPWQKALDPAPVPCSVGPGYIISRSKSKVAMTIKTDDFFDQLPNDKDGLPSNPYRDSLIGQLQQQIDDLTLYLEEERLNHRDTKRKAADQLQDKLQELANEHENELRNIELQFQEQLESLRTSHQQEMESVTEESENIINKMRSEVEFLQGAFESYKSQLHQEMDERWKKRETEMKAQHDDMIQDKLKELRSRVQGERSSEKADLAQKHQRDIQNLKQEHKKEINQLLRRFSNASKELELFKETQEELEETKKELASVKEDYDTVCSQMTNITRELTDTKVELATFQQTFQDRVELIDDKYKDQINDLMTQNANLRTLYMKKCGELFDEKNESENSRIDRIRSAKDAMKVVIETRNDTMVNLAATDPEFEKRIRPPKHRPNSAPHTKTETERALLSAGETDKIIRLHEERTRPKTCKPRILQQIQQEREDQQNTDAGGEPQTTLVDDL